MTEWLQQEPFDRLVQNTTECCTFLPICDAKVTGTLCIMNMASIVLWRSTRLKGGVNLDRAFGDKGKPRFLVKLGNLDAQMWRHLPHTPGLLFIL